MVFDDPISSLDQFRRSQTSQRIADVCQSALQTIVLSHDPVFLMGVAGYTSNIQQESLQLVRGEGDTSAIRKWDIKMARKTEYEANVMALAQYVEGDAATSPERAASAAGTLRPILEARLKIRYPNEFGEGDWLGPMAARIRDASPGSALDRLKPELRDIVSVNDFTCQFHHGDRLTAAVWETSDIEVRAHAQLTLDILGRL